MIQLAKETFLGRTKKKNVWNLGRNISKTRWRHWRKRRNVWRIPARVGIWLHSWSLPAMACSIVGAKILQKTWEGPYWEGVWPHPDHGMMCARTTSCFWNAPRKYGPHSERFFSPLPSPPLSSALPPSPSPSPDDVSMILRLYHVAF